MRALSIEGGDVGTARTVAAVLAFALDPSATGEIRSIALRITEGARSNHERAARIYSWVRRRVAYVRDPYRREHVQEPLYVLRAALVGSTQAAGDCDCHAAIVAGLLMALGIRARLVITEDPRRQGTRRRPRWAHIYAEAQTERGWVPVDSSMWADPRRPIGFGRSTPASRRTLIYPEDLSDEILDGAAAFSDDGLGYVTQIISAGTGIIRSLIGARATRESAKAQTQVAAMLTSAQERLATREMELFSESQRLDSERAARSSAQSSAMSSVVGEAAATRRLIGVAAAAAVAAGLALAYWRG